MAIPLRKKPTIRRKLGFVVRKFAHNRYMKGMKPLRATLHQLETIQRFSPKSAPRVYGTGGLGNGRREADLSREAHILARGNVPTQYLQELRRSQKLKRILERRKKLARAIAGKKSNKK